MTLTRLTTVSALTLGLLSFTGCFLFNGGGDDDILDDADSDVSDDRSDADAPVFLDFSVNTSTATDADQLTFTAVLTDPDGIEDLIGGTLKSPGGSSYGAFQTSSSEGAYSLTVGWDDLNTVEVIDLNTSAQRTFVAEFFDAAGNTSSRSIDVQLECEDDNESTCGGDGLCDPLDTRDNCGACGHDCNADLPTPPNPDETYVVVQPTCDSNDNTCWLRLEVAGSDGDTCNDVCGEWNCFAAAEGDTQIACNATATDWLTCTCDRAP